MSRQILAIDIHSDAVAAVLLETGLKSHTIQKTAYIPFEPATEQGQPFTEALNRVLQMVGVDDSTCVVALPADHAFFRIAALPFSDDKKIRQILPFELEPSMPVGIDRLVIDYLKGSSHEDKTDLVAVAIEQEVLQGYLEVFTQVRISPQLVVPGTFALALALKTLDQQMPAHSVFLNVGTDTLTLFAFIDGQMAIVRTLPGRIDTEPSIEAMALRVRQTLTAVADSQGIEFTPAQIYLSGAALVEKKSAQLFARALELPSKPIELLAYLPKIEPAGGVQYNALQMDNALALALTEAEGKQCPAFHRSSSILRNYWTTYRPYITGPAILFSAVLLLGLIGVWMEGYAHQKRLDLISARMEEVFQDAFPGKTRVGHDPAAQMASELKAIKSGGIDPGQSAPKVRSIVLLNEVSRLIPKETEVVFTRLAVGGDEVTISGEATAFNMVDEIKSRLEKADIFKQVTIASANMDKSGKNVIFKLKIDL